MFKSDAFQSKASLLNITPKYHNKMSVKSLVTSTLALLLLLFGCGCGSDKSTPIRVVTELNIGETGDVKLSNGEIVKLSLLDIKEVRDSIRDAVRAAHIKVSVDGEEVVLGIGNYNLPVEIGKIQIDCPAIKAFLTNCDRDYWSLTKDARFRLWPKGAPFTQPGTFVYPIKQKWLASMTSVGNEPDGDANPDVKSIYYHAGFDIGGVEGVNEIVSATDGVVISSGGEILAGCEDLGLFELDAKDAVFILDNRDWYLKYCHLDSIDENIKPGRKVKAGQKIGYVGKQGSSGGWVHLHFDIIHGDTFSGDFVFDDTYVYLWGAYVSQYKPALLAVARPHRYVWTGEEASFDGRKSTSFTGEINTYEWSFSDGTVATGPVQKKTHEKPGEYSEILKVTDSKGNIDYDFARVFVIDRDNPGMIPYMHASYYPTFGIRPGDPVTFLVRTFFRGPVMECNTGEETWDFGDGSPLVKVKSEFDPKNQTKGQYAETIHSFSKPGHYIIKVTRTNECGFTVFTRLYVEVK